MKHSDLLNFILNSLETDAYDFGAFIELNGLDINFFPSNDEIDYAKEYFTLHAISDGEIILYTPSSYEANSLAYSLDGENWSTFNSNTTFSVNTDDIIMVKCVANAYTRGINLTMFNGTCDYEVYGNAMSLLYGDDFEGQTELKGTSSFQALFYNQTNLKNTKNLILPTTTLAESCYSYMFGGCTSLTNAPKLPATTLAENCYIGMFNSCTSLTNAPKLPATTLANWCYSSMFYGCTSLTTAPQLLATTLADYCYDSMFRDCTSLTTAPQLLATTLADYCYNSMFRDCTSLTTAPELLATTLADYCYDSMFYGCTSLTEAPQLPATTLASNCYSYMFYGCTSLTEAPQLPARTLANYCYNSMFRDCSKLNKITMLATNINASSCLGGWVSGVASSGTFVKNVNMTTLPSGNNGIPTGWVVKSNIIPYIINKTNENITFYYNNGLFTPSNTVTAPLTNTFSQSHILSFKPNCEIIVNIANIKNDYKWTANKTLQTVMNELNIYSILDLEIIITSVIIPEEDSYYGYGYGVDLVPEEYVQKDYFTITALEDGLTVNLPNNDDNNNSNILQYSINGSNWNILLPNKQTPSINKGQTIQFVMINPTIAYGIGTFNISKKCNISGNIMSLLYGNNFDGKNDLTQHPYCFYELFKNCTTIINAKASALKIAYAQVLK